MRNLIGRVLCALGWHKNVTLGKSTPFVGFHRETFCLRCRRVR